MFAMVHLMVAILLHTLALNVSSRSVRQLFLSFHEGFMELPVRLLIWLVISCEAKVAVTTMANAIRLVRRIDMLVDCALKPTVQFVEVAGTADLNSRLVQPLAVREIREVDFDFFGVALNAVNVSKSGGVLHLSLQGRA